MIWFPTAPDWFEEAVNASFGLHYQYGDDEAGFLAALADLDAVAPLADAAPDTAAAVVLRLACLVVGYGDVSTLPAMVDTGADADTVRRLVALAAGEDDEAAAAVARDAVAAHDPVRLFGLLILAFPESIVI